jgi:hypothetical protein
MQANQFCMGIKADNTQCQSRCLREPHNPPHLRFCGVHWRSYTKRVERIARFHPGDAVELHHHQAGMCLNFHTRTRNAWCRNHAAPGHLQCENHEPLPVIDPQHELELYQLIQPPLTYQQVIDDVFRRPRLNRGDRWTIAARYYRDINPNAWENGHDDPFNEYFEWRLRGGQGLPPNEVRPQVQRGNLQVIALDRQNVHTRAVSQQTNKGLEVLLALQKQRNRTMRAPEWFASKWLVRSYGPWQAVSRTVTDIMQWYNTNTCRASGDQLYRHALDGLYLRISSHSSEEVKTELYKRTFEECFESIGLCCDGHISRLCNVLVGFDDAFEPPVPFGEILQNKMAALFALDIPTEEKLAQAIAFFNEYAVSEEERAPWLEAF